MLSGMGRANAKDVFSGVRDPVKIYMIYTTPRA
jgi:hypothetical protein